MNLHRLNGMQSPLTLVSHENILNVSGNLTRRMESNHLVLELGRFAADPKWSILFLTKEMFPRTSIDISLGIQRHNLQNLRLLFVHTIPENVRPVFQESTWPAILHLFDTKSFALFTRLVRHVQQRYAHRILSESIHVWYFLHIQFACSA